MTEPQEAPQEPSPPAQEVQTEAIAETPTTESAAVETSGDTPAPEPEKSGVQKRIDQLTWQAREAERRAQYAEQQLSSRPAPETPQPAGKPTLDMFDDYDGYVEALAGYKAKEQFEAMQTQQSREQMQAHQAVRTQNFQEKADSFSVDHPDFHQTVFENRYLPITEQMREVIESVEKGPELAYHLGKNPQEAARIANLSPYMQAAEMGKIEATLSLPKVKTTTSAPPPLEAIGGGEAGMKDLSKMSTEEFMTERNANSPRR